MRDTVLTAQVLAAVFSGVSVADTPFWADTRFTTTAQFFQQASIPGQPGKVGVVTPAFPFTVGAFARFGGGDLPNAPDVLSGEISGWGSAGPRDGRSVDADVTSAWVQYRNERARVRLGRQVTLPGASRYVRFDGVSAGVSLGMFDLDAYGGWVALPRWNQPRGAALLGFVGDGISDPLLLEAQNRIGQFTLGGRAGLRLFGNTRAAVSFHEQRDHISTAFRVVSGEVIAQPIDWLGGGARVSFDLQAAAVPEARVWVDITKLRAVPLAIDYSYQQPSLLLPHSSIFAAFGGSAWHELGAEASVRALQSLTVVARGAWHFFEGDRLGGRGLLSVRWRPGIDGRLLVIADVSRFFAPPSGYLQLRLGGRFLFSPSVGATLDSAVYFYDRPVRDVRESLTAVASADWAPLGWLRFMASLTLLRTPFAAFETQGLVRMVIHTDPVAQGDYP